MTANELKVLSVLSIREQYGLEIIKTVHKETKTTLSLGTLYNLMNRLEKKGFVESRLADETEERGGNRRRYYAITGKGARAVETERAGLQALWSKLALSGGGAI